MWRQDLRDDEEEDSGSEEDGEGEGDLFPGMGGKDEDQHPRERQERRSKKMQNMSSTVISNLNTHLSCI